MKVTRDVPVPVEPDVNIAITHHEAVSLQEILLAVRWDGKSRFATFAKSLSKALSDQGVSACGSSITFKEESEEMVMQEKE